MGALILCCCSIFELITLLNTDSIDVLNINTVSLQIDMNRFMGGLDVPGGSSVRIIRGRKYEKVNCTKETKCHKIQK